jgi:uncharacterized protein
MIIRKKALLPRLVLCAAFSVSLSWTLLSPAAFAIVPGKVQTSSYPGNWQPGPALYGAQVVNNIPVVMSDGVVLRASIAYPTDPATGVRAAGRFPVILEQTPYGEAPNTYFTEYGYLSITVQARGTDSSGGTVQFYGRQDALDGVQIVHWAAHLPQSNGKIGLFGCSWDGLLALGTAAAVGPNSPVKAIIPACAGVEGAVRDTFLPAGIPSTAADELAAFATPGPDESAETAYFNNLQAQILAGDDPAYQAKYWSTHVPLVDAEKIVDNGIPALLWNGWTDIEQRPGLETYAAFQNAYNHLSIYGPMLPGERATGRYQIIVGNWGHGGGLDEGIELEWFDNFVMGENTGIANTSTPMHLYEQGSSRWVNVTAYPTVSQYTRLFLNPGSELALSDAKSAQSAPLAWEQPDLAAGEISFDSSQLADGATIAGPVSATVYASSSNTNLELIASLYEVAPDGTAQLITNGAVLGSQRALVAGSSWTDVHGTPVRPLLAQNSDNYLMPGRIYRLEIALYPTQWAVTPGDHLRVTLSTQTDAALCQSTALTLAQPCVLTTPQAATLPGGEYSIHYGGATPSAINVPLLPYEFFRTALSGVTPTSDGVIEPLDWSSPGQWTGGEMPQW